LNNLFIVIGSVKQRGAQVVLLKKVNLVPDSLPHSNSPQNWERKKNLTKNYDLYYFFYLKNIYLKKNPIEASHTMESGYILWDICRWALGKSYWKEHSNPNTETNEEVSE